MKNCIECEKDITNQKSYRGKYCISCHYKKRQEKQIKYKNNPELRNEKKNELEKQCKKCSETLNITLFRGKRLVCRVCENLDRKKYYDSNKETEVKKRSEYKKENHDKINESRRKYRKEKYQNDIDFKLKTNIRSRFSKCLKKNKTNSTFHYIECSIDYLKNWLKYNFKENMSWENYGSKWHIDHIIPCSSFDFTVEDNINKCFHWSNLAPLDALENIKKSDKINNETIQYYNKRKEEFIKSVINT